jgi:integrase
MSLTEKGIHNTITAKAYGRYKHNSYNPGLYLQISKNGASWLFRYEIAETRATLNNGKPANGRRERWLGLGSLKTFNLKQACDRARAMRQLLADGIDPLQQREAAKAATAIAEAKKISFEAAARAYHEEQVTSGKWRNAKHSHQFIDTLERYAFPVIGAFPVTDIDKTLVLKVLKQKHPNYPAARLWDAVPETASRLRGRIEIVMGWAAMNFDIKGENPARWKGHLEHAGLVTRDKNKHHEAMSYNDISKFITELRLRNEPEAAALEFTILTAARSNEVIGARWEEIHLDAKTVTTRDEEGVESSCMGPCWIVPGDRMKGFKRHRIPLSERAVEILTKVRVAGGPTLLSTLVFNGLAKEAMWNLLVKIMQYQVTIHGFRSTFRDWASDTTNHPDGEVEKALAHKVTSKTEAAYHRTDMFDKRRKLMSDWARFCEQPKLDASVTPIRKAKVE